MTDEELNKKRKLDSYSISFDDTLTGFKLTLKGVDQMIQFFNGEMKFWSELKNPSGIINNYVSTFKSYVNDLNVLNSNVNSWQINQIEQHWNSIKGKISRSTTEAGYRILFSKSSHAQFIFDCYKSNLHFSEATHRYLIDYSFNISNKNDFIGYLKAYEFLLQDSSEFVKRSEGEQKKINDIFNDWTQKSQDIGEKFNSQSNELGTWKNDFVKTHNDWQKAKFDEYENFVNTSKTELADLKKLYTEKLKLEGPVTYWQQRAIKYRKRGRIFLSLLTINILVLFIILFAVLYNLPTAFTLNLLTLKPETVKGVIILATIVSLGIFLTRVLIKLTYSSFHLQIDADEREQLTMVYLALVKEGKIGEDERKLVFESLFSRADSGLLGGDSSPAMPGGINILDKYT